VALQLQLRVNREKHLFLEEVFFFVDESVCKYSEKTFTF